MRRLIGLVALLSAIPASGQGAVPDTTDPADYYPLDVGNEWVYVVGFEAAYSETVVADTLLQDELYAVVERRWIGSYFTRPEPDTVRFFARFDPETARVLFRDEAGVVTTDGCPLDADFPADPQGKREVTCSTGMATVSGGYDQYVEPGLFIYDGFDATTKAFQTESVGGVRYATGVGPVFREGLEWGPERLAYARVGGVAFGTPLWPDPTDPASYYPLSVGNEWEYREVSPYEGVVRERRRVDRDTTVDGVSYAVVLTSRAASDTEAWSDAMTQLLRFDPATTQIVQRVGGSEAAVTCPFRAAFNEIVGCSGQTESLGPTGVVLGVVYSEGGDEQIYGPVSEGYVAVGEDRAPVSAVKTFYDLSVGFSDMGHDGSFGAGVGPLPQTDFAFCMGCREDLTYLRLVADDGEAREYGARWSTSAEVDPEAAHLGVRAHPNPTSGPLAVTVDVPEAARVAVEAFDALGRLVWRAEADVPPGEHRLDVDASGWAPSLYVVRATAGTEAATTTVVRR